MEQVQNDSRFDLIILGASGFTGKYVLREALKFLNAPSSPLKSIATAGRSPQKLSQALQWASRPNPPPTVPILTADTYDAQSLRALCARTGLLLNCVGPFRLHGEPVVTACVHAGCDYLDLDISGEPEFMERAEAEHHERAVESGALVVSACGFDSVPAELGMMFNSRQWMGPAVPNSVEAYVELESGKRVVGNFATYESAVLGVANGRKLQELRKTRPRRPRPVILGPSLSQGETIESQKKLGLWAVRLPSADSTVVRRTLAILTKNPHGLPGLNESAETFTKRESFWSSITPAHFGVRICSKSLLGILRIIMVGVFIGLLGGVGFGKWLLLKFPLIFSLGFFRKKGPTEEEVESASFKIWFVGHGFSDESIASQGNIKPNMEIITRVMGPEGGYQATSIILIQCALIVLCQ